MTFSCGSEAAAAAASGSTLALAINFRMGTSAPVKLIRTSLRSYGHVWAAIERVYLELVERSAGSGPPRRLLVPAFFDGGRREEPAFEELQELLSGPLMAVERSRGVPICAPQAACCLANVSAPAAAAAQLSVDFHFHLTPRSRRAMRDHIWANLGMPPAAKLPPSTVLLVSSREASNGRRLRNEAAVARALREHFAERAPALDFAHVRLQDLSFREEMQLVRRTAVLVGLFGSALHNCRLLAPGSVVVELHGALKNDWVDPWMYATLCTGVGLRWLGHPVEGATPSLERVGARAPAARAKPAAQWVHAHGPRSNYSAASVDTRALVAQLSRAADGEWRRALEHYAALVSVGPSARQRGSNLQYARRLAALPQYARGGWRAS